MLKGILIQDAEEAEVTLDTPGTEELVAGHRDWATHMDLASKVKLRIEARLLQLEGVRTKTRFESIHSSRCSLSLQSLTRFNIAYLDIQ